MSTRLRQLLYRLRSLFRRGEQDRDLEAEMSAHLELAIEENLRRGLAPDEARRQALVRFGGPLQAKEGHREARSLPLLETLLQDFGFTLRMLRRNPGFALLAIFCLTLGIGANAAVFSWMEGLLFRPYPMVAHQERLVALTGTARGESDPTALSWPDFQELQKNCRLFDAFFVSKIMGTTLSFGERAQVVTGSIVSANYFTALGIHPILGRAFDPEEDVGRSAHPVTVISYQLWKERFGSDPQIIGKTQRLNGVMHTIVGVAPEGFYGTFVGWRMNFWLNLVLMALSAAGLVPIAPAPALRREAPEERWPDWAGLVLLGGFITVLIFALRALPSLAAAPWGFGSLFVLTLLALAGLLRMERGRRRPLVDFRFFAERSFAIAAALLLLSMFNIMTLLLYYNLYAQSPKGLAYSPIDAGLSLLPLSLALIGFARAAPRLAPAIGLPRLMAGGMSMTAVGCLLIYVGVTRPGLPILVLGLFVTGAGIALPYASAPRLGLSALSDSQAGQGSGMLNSCSFLGGTIGVTCGGIAFTRQGIGAVLAVVAISALLGAALCLFLRAAPAARPMPSPEAKS